MAGLGNTTAVSAIAQKQTSVARFPPDRLGDAELVEAVARGDTAAVGVVWDRYSHVVRSVLRSNLGTDAAVEDLLQEAHQKGADGYVSKILPLDELLMAIQRTFRPAAGTAQLQGA